MDIDIRPATPADLPAVLELLVAAELEEAGVADWTAEALQEEWAEPSLDLRRDTFVAWADDLPLAYGIMVDRRGSGHIHGDHYVRPGQEHWPAGRAVLDRVVARAADIARDAGHPEVTITIAQLRDAPFAISVFPEAGWRTVRRFSRMARSLSDVDTAAVALPDGVSVRTVSNEADRRSYHRIATESFSDHWGSEPETYDSFQQRIATWETNDWSLWWLATADGEDIGCLRSKPWADGAGFVDTLGVLKEGRGRGIASALLRVAFAEFARRGYTRAELGVDTDNVTGALRIYHAAGMTVVWQADVWEFRVPAT